MGTIISSRMNEEGKVIAEVALDYEEFKQLKGNMENVHLFAEDIADVRANISQRGKNEATKYFLIPKELRRGLKFTEKTSCQKIETKTSTIFIYVVDKVVWK